MAFVADPAAPSQAVSTGLKKELHPRKLNDLLYLRRRQRRAKVRPFCGGRSSCRTMRPFVTSDFLALQLLNGKRQPRKVSDPSGIAMHKDDIPRDSLTAVATSLETEQ
jgi:hypothetical protein